MSELKAVFFDVNGTLFDGAGWVRAAIGVVFDYFGSDLPTSDPAELAHHFNAVLFDQIRGQHLRREETFDMSRRFQDMLDSFGVANAERARTMASKYNDVRRMTVRQFLRPGAVPVLQALRGRDIRCGVIMNGPLAAQRNLLNSLGLRQHLDFVVMAEVEGHPKPDTRLFMAALEMAGADSDEVLFVGDSPITDMLGASRAGIPCVWFNTGHRRLLKGQPAPDFTIRSLEELLPITNL